MTPHGLPLAERFWMKVDRSGGPGECWPWTAGRKKGGYGSFALRTGVSTGAHRVAFALFHGFAAPRSVLHTCDNPPCCNPAHLYDGDQLQNVQDMISRERSPVIGQSGERNVNARLTKPQVEELRARHVAGATVLALANEMDYDPSGMSKILRGVRWR